MHRKRLRNPRLAQLVARAHFDLLALLESGKLRDGKDQARSPWMGQVAGIPREDTAGSMP